jgi:Cupin-like domain
VFRGLVAHWPVVEAARRSTDELAAYLNGMDRGATVRAFVGEPEAGGRFFYSEGLERFNFHISETRFAQLIATLLDLSAKGTTQPIYMGSTPTSEILPGFGAQNPLPAVEQRGGEPRAWIGNSSRVAAHFDESDNVACVAGGTRRFTVFPTDQVANLYVGPLDRTVAGQPTSMVDLAAPDFERFPRFREALKHARTAELSPGDAIYIPALWWHAVEAQGPLNLLVNYWWQDEPSDADSPLHAIAHGLLSTGHLADRKRARWRTLFDHYVFRVNGDPTEHIPVPARGVLGKSTSELRQFIGRFLVQKLMGR